MIRVLIIAHYAAVRTGLRTLLEEADDIEVVADINGANDTRRHFAVTQPDAVVLDAATDINLLPMLLEADVALIVLTDAPELWIRLARHDLPGWALLRKESEGREIVSAIRAATNGLIVLDRSMSRLVEPIEGSAHSDSGSIDEMNSDPLSIREREVLQLMALGLPNKQIAARLTISLSTVKFHVAAILAKMGASSRTEAVTLGIRRGDVVSDLQTLPVSSIDTVIVD